MKYNNIKRILRKQIKNNVDTYWTFDKDNMEFIQVYKIYSKKYSIYTPKQLLYFLTDLENAI